MAAIEVFDMRWKFEDVHQVKPTDHIHTPTVHCDAVMHRVKAKAKPKIHIIVGSP